MEAHLEKIKRAVAHFEKCGEILPALYPYFDQRGRWCGVGMEIKDSQWMSEATQKSWKNISENQGLKTARIPKDKLTRTDAQGGIHLNTSFIESGKENATQTLSLPFCSIKGDVITKSSQVVAPNLVKIQGHFRPKRLCTLDLPQLKEIGRDLHLSDMQNLNAPNLESVGVNLKFESSKPLPPKLKYVGNSLFCNTSYHIKLPNLEKVGGLLYCKIAQTLLIPKLKEAGKVEAPYVKNFLAPELQSLEGSLRLGATTITCPKLKKVEGHLALKKVKELYLPSLQYLGGNIQCPQGQKVLTPKLKDLLGSIELPSIGEKELKTFLKQIKNLQLHQEDWQSPLRAIALPYIEQELKERKRVRKILQKAQSKTIELW